MVPNSRPMSQCASATGATIARIWSGVASVVKSRSVTAPAEERVAHRTADERELVPGVGEALREQGDLRPGRQLLQARQSRGDALHASSLACAATASGGRLNSGSMSAARIPSVRACR